MPKNITITLALITLTLKIITPDSVPRPTPTSEPPWMSLLSMLICCGAGIFGVFTSSGFWLLGVGWFTTVGMGLGAIITFLIMSGLDNRLQGNILYNPRLEERAKQAINVLQFVGFITGISFVFTSSGFGLGVAWFITVFIGLWFIFTLLIRRRVLYL